jgi:hypothetical protein
VSQETQAIIVGGILLAVCMTPLLYALGLLG